MGRAIYHLRIAQTLKPRDSDITQNLKIARDEVHNGTRRRCTAPAHRFLNADEWALLAAPPLTGWLLWLALIYWQPERASKAAVFRPILGVLALALMAVALLAWKSEANNDWGVISGETQVGSGQWNNRLINSNGLTARKCRLAAPSGLVLGTGCHRTPGWVHADVLLTPKG